MGAWPPLSYNQPSPVAWIGLEKLCFFEHEWKVKLLKYEIQQLFFLFVYYLIPFRPHLVVSIGAQNWELKSHTTIPLFGCPWNYELVLRSNYHGINPQLKYLFLKTEPSTSVLGGIGQPRASIWQWVPETRLPDGFYPIRQWVWNDFYTRGYDNG